jgi:hypothetical protein
MPSLIIETANTKASGRMAVYGLSGEITGTDCRIAMIKK